MRSGHPEEDALGLKHHFLLRALLEVQEMSLILPWLDTDYTSSLSACGARALINILQKIVSCSAARHVPLIDTFNHIWATITQHFINLSGDRAGRILEYKYPWFFGEGPDNKPTYLTFRKKRNLLRFCIQRVWSYKRPMYLGRWWDDDATRRLPKAYKLSEHVIKL